MIDQLLRLHDKIDTPALIIDGTQCDKNIRAMQDLANSAQVELRPHLKTHKSAWIANKQIESGATGVTVAKLSEAELMSEMGITDILIANQVTHPLKIIRLIELNNKINLSVGIDHPDQVDLLVKEFSQTTKSLRVRIEIDSGLHRCGVEVGKQLIILAEKIMNTPCLDLEGLFTHAGQVYGSQSEDDVKKAGEEEGKIIEAAVNILNQKNIPLKKVSVGSTPTVRYSAFNPVVTEIRPGNYVFYDNIQCSLKSSTPNDCALFVLGTIISQPANDRVVIDTGSKALGLDRGAHATNLISGFGRLLNIGGTIERLSEEHGVIILESPHKVRIGSAVLVIPNHACAVVNLYDKYYLIENENQVTELKVDARGFSR